MSQRLSGIDDSPDIASAVYRATLDALTNHIAILDENGVIVAVNAAWRRFAEVNGYTGRDFGLGANYLEYCERGDSACQEGAEVAQGIRDVLAGRISLFTREYPCHSPGEQRWFLMRVTRLATPEHAGVVVEHENVTAEKLATQQLQALRFCIDRSADAMYWLRPDQGFRLAFANAAAVRHFGYTEAELLQTTAPDWAPAFTPERCESFWRQLRQVGNQVFECTHRRKDGTLVPVEVSCNHFNFDGVDYITGSFRDISERKAAEQTLMAANAKFESVFNQSGIYAGIMDLDGYLREVNDLAVETCGYTREQVLGRLFWDTPWWRGSPQVQNRIREAAEAARRGSVFRDILPYWLADGSERVTDFAIHPIRDPQGRVIFLHPTGVDITERRQAEEALREADRRKDEFLAVLGHELRNPLAPIRNAVQVLRLRGPAEPVLQQARDMIDRQAVHMTRLVDDLLEVSRITRGKIRLEREPVQLADAVSQALDTSRPLIDARQHRLSLRLPPAPVLVLGDKVRLAQVVSNLLNNAAKYTEVGGRIELAAERIGGELVLTVTDSGVGIPRDMLGRVFDIFEQVESSLDRSQGGLGIGLTLVRRLVEMHGGSVAAHSEGPGRGSRFVVRLPALPALPDAAVGAPLVRAAVENASVEPRRRIMVVDDNTDSAASLGMVLRLWQHDVHIAHDGLSALNAATDFRPQVMLLDLGLPKLDGFEVARRVRTQPELAQMLLVAMTGYGQEEDRRRTNQAGFDSHLVKPVDLGLLQALLRAPVRATTPNDPAARGPAG